MKKTLVTLLILTLLANTLFLGGCGKNGEQQSNGTFGSAENIGDFVLCSDKSFILTGDEYKVTFNIQSNNDTVALYCDDAEMEQLYDDGDMAQHGDTIKGDGIFSVVISMNESKSAKHVFCAEANGKKSNAVTIEVKENIADSDYDDMDNTNTQIQETVNDADFDNLPIEKRKALSDKKLQELVDNGYIMKDSLNYSEESKTYSFKYSSGIIGILEIGDRIDENGMFLGGGAGHKPLDAKSNLKNKLTDNLPIKAAVTSNNIDSKRIIENKALLIFDYVVRGETLKQNGREYSFQQGYSVFENKANEWEETALDVETLVNPSVEDYKTSLNNKGIVLIGAHGTRESPGWFQAKESVICVNEKCTKANNKKYERDLSKHFIGCNANNSGYYIFPEFFIEYYSQNRLSDTVMFLGNCFAFGTENNVDYTLSDTFQQIGASTVIGSVNESYVTVPDNTQNYSIDLLFNTIDLMLDGNSISDSFATALSRLGNNFDEYCQKYFTDYYAECDEQEHQKNRNHYSVIRTNANIGYYLEEKRPIEDLVVDAMRESATVRGFNYEYAIPKIKLSSNDASEVNQKILNDYGKEIDDEIETIKKGFNSFVYKIDYSYSVNSSILSVKISEIENGNYSTYSTYNFDISSGKLLTSSELLSKYDYTEADIILCIQKDINNRYDEYGSKYEEQRRIALKQNEKLADKHFEDSFVLVDNNVFYIDENNNMHNIYYAKSVAGAEGYYYDITLSK